MKYKDLPEHHFIFIIHSDRKTVASGIFDEIKENASNIFWDKTVFDIDSARELISWSKGETGKRVAVITFSSITLIAQNALLKALEEPKDGVGFVFITNGKENILKTVLSRAIEINERDNSLNQDKDIEEFLKKDPSLRIKLPFITKMLSSTDEEGRKDREKVSYFLNELISVLSKRNTDPKLIKKIINMTDYSKDPSSSSKNIIEYISLLIPKF